MFTLFLKLCNLLLHIFAFHLRNPSLTFEAFQPFDFFTLLTLFTFPIFYIFPHRIFPFKNMSQQFYMFLLFSFYFLNIVTFVFLNVSSFLFWPCFLVLFLPFCFVCQFIFLPLYQFSCLPVYLLYLFYLCASLPVCRFPFFSSSLFRSFSTSFTLPKERKTQSTTQGEREKSTPPK